MARIKAHRESLHTTMAYVFSDNPFDDRVYRLDNRGRCTCEGAQRFGKCRHTSEIAKAITQFLATAKWKCTVDVIFTPWSAKELGLTNVEGLTIRATP
jgi:tRNA(Glu) U13 pseudouridine synthase TruD